MHICITDFGLGPEDFLKALPLGYGPKGLWYHPEKPVWLIPHTMLMTAKRNFDVQDVPEEKSAWIYTDDPQMVVLDGFTLPAHPLEYK